MANDAFAILESRIRNGIYRPGEWLPPERLLSEELGVNRGTLRRALARLCEAGIITCERGHRPIVNGRPGSSGPHTVALMMGNEPLYHAFQVVMRGCEPVLREHGYRLHYLDTWATASETYAEREVDAFRSLLTHPVSAVILWCQNEETAIPWVRALQERATPVVAIDRMIAGIETDYVGIDNFGASRASTEHLLDLGHRRIAFVRGQETATSVREREEGYRRALISAGIEPDPSLLYSMNADSWSAEAERLVCDLRRPLDRPTAILAVNDILAQKLAVFLGEQGFQVPGDVALMGFDDSESFSVSGIGLSSVHQSYESMGRHAARLVCRRIQNPTAPLQHVVLETRIVARSSTLGRRLTAEKPLILPSPTALTS